MLRIDKDNPEHREEVFAYVRKEVGFDGHPPADASAFLGNWTYRFVGKAEPFAYKSFHADGSAPGKAVDGSFDSPKDKWKLNEDGSFSDWYYYEANPEYDLEAGYGEEAYHVLFKDADTFVLFNGMAALSCCTSE